MTSPSAFKARFKNDAVETAAPSTLLVMLMERLCLDIKRAEVAQQDENWQSAHESLLNAQGIVSALSEALDPKWEHTSTQADIYQFLYRQLVAANLRRDPAFTTECLHLAEPVRDTWVEVVTKAAAETSCGTTSTA